MKFFRPIARRRLLALASRRAGSKGRATATANGHHHVKENGTANGNGNGNGNGIANGNGNGNGWSREKKSGTEVSRTKRLARQEAARERKAVRFAEQGWSFVYYCVFWIFGMVRTFLFVFLTRQYFS